MEKITCYKCGKSELLPKQNYKRDILFLYHQNEGRKPTCQKCAVELSKSGIIPCVNRYYHHIGSTCKICGMID